MLPLNTNIKKINRVGEIIANRLKKLNLLTIEDMLFYFPFKYDNFTKLSKIKNLQIGETVNIIGKIELIQNKRSQIKKINITEAFVSDETETIKIIWFNNPFITKNLKIGDKISLTGKIKNDYTGMTMHSPDYEKIISNKKQSAQGLVPNYNLTANITQKQIRFLIKQILNLSFEIKDWLPNSIIKNQKLLSEEEAIQKIHFPKNKNDINQAKKRLGFNELFLIQLQSQIIYNEQKTYKSQKIKFNEKLTKKFVNNLSFTLTNSQKKSAWRILQDIGKNKPMSRLLEGDVGSGKTIVAIIAFLNTSLNNYQSVLMVPTEILAKQHFEYITKLFKNFNIEIVLLTRNNANSNKKNQTKKNIINSIKNGKSKIIIGTHSLIQEKIKFNNLALVTIDEQHRFGVEQRKKIIEKSNLKSKIPHLLSMTATPIPRSLALAIYGDLNISIINELPKNRKKIITKVVNESERVKIYNFIKKIIKNGQQIFIICPLIDISDKLSVKSVKQEYEKFKKNIFPEFKIGLLHGKLKSKEKEQTMKNFLNNKIKILVSTSVVEVGIDIPNATIMMIEEADRFGLAQLHQFRGRVGRGENKSYCFLFTENKSKKTLDRLNALTKYNNGLELAKIDLKSRGPGKVYGKEQKGFPKLKIATLFDYELMKNAKEEAKKFIKNNYNLNNHSLLKNKLTKQNKIIHFE